MPLIPARLKGASFIGEVDRFADDEEEFHLWWLGQSGYLLTWKGERMLIDPYLSDSLTEKYRDTSKPHIRMSELVVDPGLLRGISVVTSSHNHTDHLDAFTLGPIIKNNPGVHFIVPEANRQFVSERIGKPVDFPVGLNDGRAVTMGVFAIHGVPASHNTVERDENGNCRFMGYVIRFGRWNVYHSGDTLWFDGMEKLLDSFQVDLALLPINGNDPSRGVAGNLSGREAARLAKSIGAKMVIPCHYDMFTFNTADPSEFAAAAASLGQPYTILGPGGHFSSAAIDAAKT